MTTNERKARHKALLKEVAALIEQPVDSLAVKLVSLARLKMDTIEAQLLAGDITVTVADITTLQETFDKYVPKPTTHLDLHVVETAEIQQCPACKHKFDLATVRRTLAEAQENARLRDAQEMASKKTVSARQGAVLAPAENNEPQATATSTNVVPIDPEQRKAELREAARKDRDGYAPPPRPPAPRVSPLFDSGGESISAFQRRVDAAYRGVT